MSITCYIPWKIYSIVLTLKFKKKTAVL